MFLYKTNELFRAAVNKFIIVIMFAIIWNEWAHKEEDDSLGC